VAIAAQEHELDKLLPEIIHGITGAYRARCKRIAARLIPRIRVLQHDNDVLRQVTQDATDVNLLSDALPKLLTYRAPGYRLPNPLAIRIVPNGQCFRIETNIELGDANKFYTERNASQLKIVTLLTDYLTISDSLRLSATTQSELATGPILSQVIQSRINGMLQRRAASAQKIDSFQQLLFEDSRSIREVINSGQRTFRDLLELLQKAEQFKQWLKEKSPDNALVREYYKTVTANSWVDKLPGKTARWSVFTGLGLAADAVGAGGLGTATGVALSAFDQFYLDKLLHGWKPNQFVDGPLQSFVAAEH
jgi:hypothetical protein